MSGPVRQSPPGKRPKPESCCDEFPAPGAASQHPQSAGGARPHRHDDCNDCDDHDESEAHARAHRHQAHEHQAHEHQAHEHQAHDHDAHDHDAHDHDADDHDHLEHHAHRSAGAHAPHGRVTVAGLKEAGSAAAPRPGAADGAAAREHDREHAHDAEPGRPHDHSHAGHAHGGHAHAGHAHAGHSHAGHSHAGHAHAHGAAASRALLIAMSLTATFMVVEFVAGRLTGSLALMADAGHMLSDSGSLVLAYLATHLARRPRSPRKTFGYKRFEVLAAMVNGAVLAVTAVLVAVEAWERWNTPQPVAGAGVVAVGLAGLALNLGCAWILHGGGGAQNVNVRAALAHVLGDALGSVAAVTAGVIVWKTGETRADPALSVLVALLLLWGAWRLVSETTHILMEGSPEGIDPLEVSLAIAQVPGVASVHDLHVWSITSGEPAVTAHVVLKPGSWHGDLVARAVCDALERRFGLRHATIQPEAAPPGIVQLRTRAHAPGNSEL